MVKRNTSQVDFSFIPVVGPEVTVAGERCLIFSYLELKKYFVKAVKISTVLECRETLALATARRALERMVWHISDKSPISLMSLYK